LEIRRVKGFREESRNRGRGKGIWRDKKSRKGRKRGETKGWSEEAGFTVSGNVSHTTWQPYKSGRAEALWL